MGKLPKVLRWVFVTLAIILVAAAGAYAYVALQATGTIEITEPLSWVGLNTFAITLMPLETASATLTLANASASPLEVDLIPTIVPDPGAGTSIAVPNKLTIPALGQASFNVDVTVGKSAPPGSYQVTVDVDR